MRNLRTFLSFFSLFQVVILIPILTVGFSYTNVWGASVTRGPYLQLGTPTSIVVRWRTDVATNSRVRYGDNPSNLTMIVDDLTNTTEHEITLTGLAPDTMYHYSIGTTTETLAGGDFDHYFVTSPLLGTAKPTRIWVIGDSGTSDANAAAVRDAYISFTGTISTDVWLMLGDNAYPMGTDIQYQQAVFDMYPTLLRNTVLWPTPGNHDTEPNGVGSSTNPLLLSGPYFDMFTMPTLGEAGGLASGTEAYYSFDYGNIHFINLDSTGSDRSLPIDGGAMLTWLQNDLSSNIQDWIIAFFHHPPYTRGSHDSDVCLSGPEFGGDVAMCDMRANALPILEAGGVDLVLAGHSHSYERSFLVDGHYGTSGTFDTLTMIKDAGDGRISGNGAYSKTTLGPAPNEGAIYAVAGSSGKAKIGTGTLDHPVMYVSLVALGSMVLDVDSAQLDAIFIDDFGTVQDNFTIVKGSGNPWGITVTPTSGLTTTEAGGTDTFTVVLDSQPAANVTIGISSSNTAEGTVDKASLTFGTGDWDIAQQVTVTGVDDSVADGDIAYNIVTAAATSIDPDYDLLDASDVGVTNTDNDALFSDIFNTDTTGDYTVTDTQTAGGFGSFQWDSAGQRARVLTGDNVGLMFSQNVSPLDTGTFSIDFLPTTKYPAGGIFKLVLRQDANNFYLLKNTDGYGPKFLKKEIGGINVDNTPFLSEYSQNNNYSITIDFSPGQTTVNAFGEVITINTNQDGIIINSFEIELQQQDAYIDNISYSGQGTPNQEPNGVINTPTVNQTITAGGSVAFTGTGTDPEPDLPLAHLWNFGAGSGVANSTVEDPGSITFNTVGVFTVTYTVTDGLGLADSTPSTVQVTVQSPPANQEPDGVIDTPTVNQIITAGESVAFTGTGTDPEPDLPLAHLWNFGAGSGITDSTFEDPGSITFNTVGVFTVTYTVTDGLGLADSTPSTVQITVNSGTSSFSDDFNTDTTGDYTVTDTETTGGFGSFQWDSTGQRARVLTGDNVGLMFSQNVSSLATGTFSIDFLPTTKYPKGGIFKLFLRQDANNFYLLKNTDGYGPKFLKKEIGGINVDNTPFLSEYSQNNNYSITIDFSPGQTTVNAFGEVITINTNQETITINSFEIELNQQDAYLDNISYSD